MMKMEPSFETSGTPDAQATAQEKEYGKMQNETATKEDIVAMKAGVDNVQNNMMTILDANRVYIEGAISKNTGELIMWVTATQIATIGVILIGMVAFLS